MPNLKPLTKQRWVVSVDGSGNSITFDTCTGMQVERSQTDFNDGVTGQTKTALGFVKNGNITLGKVADEETDAALRTWVDELLKTSTPFTVSMQAVTVNKTGDPVTSYKPITATGCEVCRVKYPEPERTSNDLDKWEVELIVNGDVS